MMRPTFELEYSSGCDYVVGIDEAGCGPWAGPVTVACAVFKKSDWQEVQHTLLLNDSKKLSKTKRELLFPEIQERALSFGIASASPKEIDALNIVGAVALATKRAVAQLTCPIDVLLIDGIRNPQLPHPTSMVVKGDSRSCSIAAASILAKVSRDRHMHDLATEHPHYGWERNAGYGTKLHQEALRIYGITAHHRLSYSPIKILG